MLEVHEERLRPPAMRRISWGAVFAGLAVALVLQLLLSLLGLGIGAGAVRPTSPDGASAQSLGTGGAIWFLVSSVISLFCGGWVAGRVAGIPHRLDGALHGVIAWSLTTLCTVYLLTTAVGGVVGGVGNALGSVLGAAGSAAGSGIAAVAPGAAKAVSEKAQENGITVDTVTSKVETLLNETGNARLSPEALKAQAKHQGNLAKKAARGSALDPNAAKQNYNELVYRFLHDTGATSRSADRQALINVVAAEQHVSKAQAAKTVDGWSEQAQQAQQEAKRLADEAHEKAKQAGDAAAAATSKAAFSAFLLVLLGGIAAAAGGLVAIRSIVADGAPVTVVGPRTV